MAIRNAANRLRPDRYPPEGVWYTLKRRLLGPPMVNEQLREQRLSKTLALGVLAPDGISSSAYGTEEILIVLLQMFGIAAFSLILPMTGVILFVMVLVVLSYREVVTVYTKAGGSYVVARENFGPRIAQVAAVALLIDYVVTVAVQVAAGTAAIASAIPSMTQTEVLWISVGIVLLMCYGNLRGLKEAGKVFALPTYLFSAAVILMISVGLVRQFLGNLPVQPIKAMHDNYTFGSSATGLIAFAAVFALLKAFANGGSSLTGIEAVSNAVSAFKPPEGINARRVLVVEGLILGTLVAGISWLAHATHANPQLSGYPTVISQEANLVFGHAGHFMFFVVQAATALILYTGGNTSFNGFPFLTSFVAEDSFLPRWMTKRGHRLVFSNGIIVLTVAAVALLITAGSNVNNLVPFYAIGVFTAFSMAGYGMAKYHHRTKEPGWRRRLVINFSAGVTSTIVVVIFAIVKFTEGAWLIVIIFPVLVFALIRLNGEYAKEAHVLEQVGGQARRTEPRNYQRRTALLLVDSFDLATLAALRYARSLRPTSLRAVHFVIDTAQADMLRQEWMRTDRGVVLEFVDCPDRRLARAAADLVRLETAEESTYVTVVLPRRSYSPLLGRLLHDRTADRIAGVVSRIPRCAATIIPFDVRSRIDDLHARTLAKPGEGPGPDGSGAGRDGGPAVRQPDPAAATSGTAGTTSPAATAGPGAVTAPATGEQPGYDRPVPSGAARPIGSIHPPDRATVEGRVRSVEIRPVEKNTVLACEISDSTGDLTALFYGRSHITGIICGSRVRFRGPVGVHDGTLVMVNPAYELITPGEDDPGSGKGS